MRNTKKRIASLVMVIAMLVMCLASCSSSGTASIDDANGSYGSFTWTYTKETKTLAIHGAGAMPDARSSSEVGWSSVRLGVEKVVLDGGITTIGDYAFYYMPYLTEIKLNEGTTYVGKYAFAFCQKLGTMILPDGVTEVGESAFEACSSLTAVRIPASTVKLGAKAFSCCSMLETVQCLGNIEKLNDRTFYYCSSLEKLILSSANENVECSENAFENCKIDRTKAIINDADDASCKITINYVFENGDTAAEARVLSLALAAAYSEVSPDVPGYTPDQHTVTGTANGIDETFTVTYKAVEVAEPEKQENESEKTEEDSEFGVTDIIAIVIFAVVLIGIGVAAFFLIRSDKKGNKSMTVRKNTPDGKNSTASKNAKNTKNTKNNKK